MKILKYLQSPSDLPWIIISHLILALSVAHFGAVMENEAQGENAEIQEIQMPEEQSSQGNGTIYIIRMGNDGDECIITTADGVEISRTSIDNLNLSSLDGKPVIDLSLPIHKQDFFIKMSQKFKENNMNMGIAYSKVNGGSK
ncbi:hypothetical protein GF312_12535 [Candidatus Poribacteria bacterium]|nr:hypothetical protein [Candidatus Poribacteria bacterium]